MSQFREIAKSISVEEICKPFIATFNVDDNTINVYEKWAIELCDEKGLDPMEQIALIVKDQSIVGWLGFDMLDTESNLNDCIEVLKPNQIISSVTNLITLVDIFHKSKNPIFFVLRNNNIIGWISYIDLHGAPLGICLLAQILEIEKNCLNLCLLNPENNFTLLSTQQRNNVMSNYLKNNFSLNKDGKPYFAKTMELLPLKVKLYVLQKLFPANDIFTNLNDVGNINIICSLRNKIVHPMAFDNTSTILSRENLWKFIEWMERLDNELTYHYNEEVKFRNSN